MKRLLAFCVISLLASVASASTVGGKVAFLTKRGQSPVPNETLLWLEPASGARVVHRPPGTSTVVTRSKMLEPHVIAIPVGSTVEFPNDDPISHNLFSLSPASAFDLGLYRKGAGKSHKFDQAGIVNVYCNVHPNMSSVIHVMATPYYAFADASGKFALSDVPPGKYRLVAWNEQGGSLEEAIEVSANGTVSGNLSLTFDSRTFRVSEHTNKEGKRYTAPRTRDY